MKKSATSTRLPISHKAYKGFIDRIYALLGHTVQASSLVTALDLYLKGDKGYAAGLDVTQQLAFAFLRQDIDVAIERSRKARERAALRKQTAESEKDYIEFKSHDELLGKIYEMAGIPKNDEGVYTPPLSRRDRRAFERKARKEINRDVRCRTAKTR